MTGRIGILTEAALSGALAAANNAAAAAAQAQAEMLATAGIASNRIYKPTDALPSGLAVGTDILKYYSDGVVQRLRATASGFDEIGEPVVTLTGAPAFSVTSVPDLRTRVFSAKMRTRPVQTLGYYGALSGGGAIYDPDPSDTTTPDNGGTVIVCTGSGNLRYKLRLTANVDVKWFGAKGDGTTNDTAAFQAALNAVLVARTYNARGQNQIWVPKGRYRIETGLTAAASIIGLQFAGAGQEASVIEFANDTDPFLNATTYIHLRFVDLTISHVPISADTTTWTNSLVKLSGVGGGRKLTFERVTGKNFNRVLWFTGNVNGDTTFVSNCGFEDFGTFLYARNSQGVANTFQHTSFFGRGNLFDVAGYGQTQVTSGNIVIEGAWLLLDGSVSGLWGSTANFTFENCKGEPYNKGLTTGARTAIVRLQGEPGNIGCQIKLINCGLTSGVEFDPDPLYPQIELGPNMHFEWYGGQLKNTAKIRLRSGQISTPYESGFHRGALIRDLLQCPLPSQVSRDTPDANAKTWPALTFEGCHAVPNLTMVDSVGGGTNVPAMIPRARQRNAVVNGLVTGIITYGPAQVCKVEFYGARQVIEELYMDISYAYVGNVTVEVSTDNFVTVAATQTIPITATGRNQPSVKLAIPDGLSSTQGLYVRTTAANATLGHIHATIRART